jgi:predicted transglutaminase-like cysteine proteinase
VISSLSVRCARLGVGLSIVVMASGLALDPVKASDLAMFTGGLASQPVGHYEFCKANPKECSIRSRETTALRMTGKLWREIASVNAAVNNRVEPISDFTIYGKDEVWAYPDAGVGDCEDYVLEKRRALIDSGIAVSNLLITVVRKPDGEGHSVLTVRTDEGDFVLDNLTDKVRLWSETGYRYLKRQASNHTGHWVSILGGDATLVGSVR